MGQNVSENKAMTKVVIAIICYIELNLLRLCNYVRNLWFYKPIKGTPYSEGIWFLSFSK